MCLDVADADSCEHYWLAGTRVELSSISPFVWKLSPHEQQQQQGCTEDIITALRYDNWASDQPDNAGDKTTVRQACLAMLNTEAKQWDDLDCAQRTCAICEYHENENDDDDDDGFAHH